MLQLINGHSQRTQLNNTRGLSDKTKRTNTVYTRRTFDICNTFAKPPLVYGTKQQTNIRGVWRGCIFRTLFPGHGHSSRQWGVKLVPRNVTKPHNPTPINPTSNICLPGLVYTNTHTYTHTQTHPQSPPLLYKFFICWILNLVSFPSSLYSTVCSRCFVHTRPLRNLEKRKNKSCKFYN